MTNAPSPTTELLRVRGLAKSFGALRVLEDVTFSVQAGECFALCGENGAGKSTLLRILMGLETHDAGDIRTPAGGIGMVHQHFSLVPALTVAENVWLGAEPLRCGMFDAQAAREATQTLASSIGWRVDGAARVETLTVGERQRVEVLKALRSGAKLLLLDEPTATLTQQEVVGFLEVVRGLAARGTAVVFVSHKLREVAALCSRAVVLRKGRVAGEFKAADQDAIAQAMVESSITSVPSPGVADAHGDLLLRAEHLSATRQASVLKDASFELKAGQILGIAGVDGNGQDALFAAIAGTVASRGRIEALGDPDFAQRSPFARRARGLRCVPADKHRDALLAGRTVGDNLLLGHSGVHDVLARLQRWDVRPADPDKDVSELSGGNQQKLLFARELDESAKLLLLHEPTRGVDWLARDRIWSAIRAATERGAACLVISSDFDELKALSTELAVLYRGVLSRQSPLGTLSDQDVGRAMGGVS